VNYFLAKSEPDTYSIDDLERDKRTIWDGVKNAQAVRAILQMQVGDRVFIYHSGGVSALVGWAKVYGAGVPDPKSPKSAVAGLEFGGKLDHPTTLTEVKQSQLFDDWALVRQSRLSTMAVPDAFVEWMRKKYPKAGL
jgi:predicted RNA-binding protein with PUA-like domain